MFPSSRGASASGQHEEPPPPYESVVMSDAGMSTMGRNAPQEDAQNSSFDIQVKDPIKHGENSLSAYVSYKVCTKTSLQQYQQRQSEVLRRFKDFAWLRHQLQEQNRGIVIPALPEKSVVQKYQMTNEFIAQRQRALTIFLNRVAVHPALQHSRDLQNFLEMDENNWALEMARGSQEAARRKPGAFQFLRDFGQSTANIMAGKTADEEEDPDYIKVRESIVQLETHLAEIHRQASRLVKKQAEHGVSLEEFSASMAALGKCEKQPPLSMQFERVAEWAGKLAKLSKEQADALSLSFEEPLKECVRTVRSAKKVIADRSSALLVLQQAKMDLDAKRTRSSRLRSSVGVREDRIAENERETKEAQGRQEAAKVAYETICRRMNEELSRFQQQRAQETSQLLYLFAKSQAQLANDNAHMWAQLVPTANGGAH
ncbi:hypothetical protein WJX84_000325 [Apatococcus fuscideae]|uniref:PX domain-containing protein n=1 Tax=Apatococcus fuscideae TaxID=2026836 RepID=A0AAW1SVB0_9CHLO